MPDAARGVPKRGWSAVRLGREIGLLVCVALFVAVSAFLLVTRSGRASDYRVEDDLAGGVVLVEPSGGVILRESVRVTIAIDEEWRARLDGDAVGWARSLLSLVSGQFRGVGIHLLAVRVIEWRSPDEVLTVGELFDVLVARVPVGGADLVLGLTAQPLAGGDGQARIGGRHVVVAQHVGHPERDVMVAAHEIAHTFGARHGCDAQLHDGLMAEEGFNEPALLCPATREILMLNSGRFGRGDAP